LALTLILAFADILHNHTVMKPHKATEERLQYRVAILHDLFRF